MNSLFLQDGPCIVLHYFPVVGHIFAQRAVGWESPDSRAGFRLDFGPADGRLTACAERLSQNLGTLFCKEVEL